MLAERVGISNTDLTAFCEKHHIRKLALFGSVLREDFNSESDIDVLVEFEPQAKIGFFEFMDIEMELSQLMRRQVDLNTYGFLNPHIQARVKAQEQVLYESQS